MLSHLRVAIVGAGLMGRWHARYAVRCAARITAVVDADARRARDLQKNYRRAKSYDTLRDCLIDTDIDIVHICTPVDSHAALAGEALSAGKHVLLEKPAAGSCREVQALVDAARANNVKWSCVHQMPFQRGFRQLRREMDRIGELTRVTFTAFTAGGEGRAADARRSVLLEILPHPLSLFQALFRDRIENWRWGVTHFSDDDLDIAGRLDDVPVSIHISLNSRPTRNELLVCGCSGTAQLNLYHGYVAFQSGGVSRAAKVRQPFGYGASVLVAAGVNLAQRIATWEPAYPGLRELIAVFYGAVRGYQLPPVDDAEMLQVGTFIDRVRDS